MDSELSRMRREPSAEDALSMERVGTGFRDDVSITKSPSMESVGEDRELGRRSGARPRGLQEREWGEEGLAGALDDSCDCAYGRLPKEGA
jgi:hypothetical protein